MSELKAYHLKKSFKHRTVVNDVSLRIKQGTCTGLLGPNGAGKTTAVRALLGLQPLSAGYAHLDGQPSQSLTPKQRALRVSYLPQARKLAWPIAVREAVSLGRFAYGGPMGRLGPVDAAAVEDAAAPDESGGVDAAQLDEDALPGAGERSIDD